MGGWQKAGLKANLATNSVDEGSPVVTTLARELRGFAKSKLRRSREVPRLEKKILRKKKCKGFFFSGHRVYCND